MKIKTIIIIDVLGCILLAAFIIGITGGLSLHEKKPEEYIGDSFVGVLITREPLDLDDKDTVIPEDNAKIYIDGREATEAERQNLRARLYAKISDLDNADESEPSKEYVFDGVEGIRFFGAMIYDKSKGYWNLQCDEEITDASWGSTSMSGTIYMVPRKEPDLVYLNRVYQTPEGSVYAVSDDDGVAVQNGLRISLPADVEGRAGLFDNAVEASSVKLSLNIKTMDKPERIALLQFGSGDELLEKKEYQPGTLPKHMDSFPGAQYMIVETTSADGVSRTLYQKGDRFAEAFCCRDDGICIKQDCEINWK